MKSPIHLYTLVLYMFDKEQKRKEIPKNKEVLLNKENHLTLITKKTSNTLEIVVFQILTESPSNKLILSLN